MLWIFIKQQETLRCEVRRPTQGRGFELALTRSDGLTQTERYTSVLGIFERQRALEDFLIATGWYLEQFSRQPSESVVLQKVSS